MRICSRNVALGVSKHSALSPWHKLNSAQTPDQRKEYTESGSRHGTMNTPQQLRFDNSRDLQCFDE
jgi:hypothetical protein